MSAYPELHQSLLALACICGTSHPQIDRLVQILFFSNCGCCSSETSKYASGVQVNEILEALLQQLQAHNHPHASAVQAAINLTGPSFAPHRPSNQVHHLSNITAMSCHACCQLGFAHNLSHVFCES